MTRPSATAALDTTSRAIGSPARHARTSPASVSISTSSSRSRDSAARRRARSMTARRLATVSRQPSLPQRQPAPSSVTRTWPISPAPPSSPSSSRPRTMTPAPTPSAMLMTSIEPSSGRRSNVHSATAAAFESFITRTGSPRRASSRCWSGRSRQSSPTAQRTTPERTSTSPAVPTPTPSERPLRAADEERDERLEVAQRRLPVTALERAGPSPDDLAAQVDDDAAELLAVDVDADEVAGAVGDAQEDRGLAAGRGTHPGLLREAVRDETVDDVADRRARQPGRAGDVRAADRAALVDRAQDEALVRTPRRLMVGPLHAVGASSVPGRPRS